MNKPAPKASAIPAIRFREEIASAVASGSPTESLLLNLTLMDASKLKRDRQVAMEDICFSGGEMRFLGVRVKQGGIASSTLQLEGADAPDAPSADTLPAPPAKKRARASKAA